MSEFDDCNRPSYDMCEGLGRRRRLARLGIDPDELVSVQETENLEEENEQ